MYLNHKLISTLVSQHTFDTALLNNLTRINDSNLITDLLDLRHIVRGIDNRFIIFFK